MQNKKLILFFIFYLIAALLCGNCENKYQWIDTLPKPWAMAESEISEILPDFYHRFPNFEDRLKAITLWKVGTPYEVFKLGEEAPPDSDPLIRLDVADCTVHVLTSLVFAQSKTWNEAREKIVKVHYKEDENDHQIPTYKSRWHFTSERILFNPYTVNITDELFEKNNLEKVDLLLNIKNNSSELLDLGWSTKVKIAYIPNDDINQNLLVRLPDVCGIAFVRKAYFANGLAIAHEGILIDRRDLVHSSSDAGKTVIINFLDYYFDGNKPKFDGIMIYEFVPFN